MLLVNIKIALEVDAIIVCSSLSMNVRITYKEENTLGLGYASWSVKTATINT